jgi:hypothetical protein
MRFLGKKNVFLYKEMAFLYKKKEINSQETTRLKRIGIGNHKEQPPCFSSTYEDWEVKRQSLQLYHSET